MKKAAILWSIVITLAAGFYVVRAAWEPPPADCDPNVNPAACNRPGPIWNSRDGNFPPAGQNADINIAGRANVVDLVARGRAAIEGAAEIGGALGVFGPSTFHDDIAVQNAGITIDGNQVCHQGNNCNLGGGNVPNLQQVTDVGNTTTNTVTISANDVNNPSLTVRGNQNAEGGDLVGISPLALLATNERDVAQFTSAGGSALDVAASTGIIAADGAVDSFAVGSKGTGEVGVVGVGTEYGLIGNGGKKGVLGRATFGVFAEGVGDNDNATPDTAVGLYATAYGGSSNYAAQFKNGDVLIGEDLEVRGTSLFGEVATFLEAVINRTLRVSGATTIDNLLTVNRPGGAAVSVKGNSNFTGTSGFVGDVTIKGKTLIDGRLTVTQGCAGCADVAESVTANENLMAGEVVILDVSSKVHVRRSSTPYDRRVAGVISTDPTFVMGDEKSGVPLALVGIVSVNVSTENGAIHVGDLLTTASLPGYAMRATDPVKSFGAVIGKAMEPFSGKKGSIDVLVNLQ